MSTARSITQPSEGEPLDAFQLAAAAFWLLGQAVKQLDTDDPVIDEGFLIVARIVRERIAEESPHG